jgi:acetate kinase
MLTSAHPILVINNGSSSLKFSVLDPKSETLLSSGLAERIGTEQGSLKMTDLGLASSLNSVDALIFTGGIGENSAFIRSKVLSHLAILHPEIDPKLNDDNGKQTDGRITTGLGLLCLVIPTNEELMIARETDRLIP